MGKEITQKELEKVITEFLQKHSSCIIATCSDSMPRASTVEYFPQGLTVYILTEGGRKLENINKNPQVSIAISDSFTDWESLRGVQITGAAQIGTKGSDIFNEGLQAYKRRRGLRKASVPDFMKVVRIIPIQLEYIDSRLEKKGYQLKHTLTFV